MRGKYCYLILFLTFTTAFSAPPKRSGKPKTTSCGLTKLMANALMKEFTSPGYPGEFPEQTQCTWLIHAPRGFRVKAKLRDFYLLNQNSNCKMQYLLFTDDYTGKKYGPLCGKMPKEEIISSANTLRIKLESDSVDIGIPYRGFKFTYTQTTEPTSEVLRDKAGLWRKYFVPSATVAPSLMPTDDTIDDNDNESINRRNQLKNLKNDKANDERKVENFVTPAKTVPQKFQPTLKPTTFPGRWIPPKRIIKRPIVVKTRRPPTRTLYPGYRNVPKTTEKEAEGSSGMNTAKYIAIIVAVVLVAAVLIFAAFKIRRRKNKKKKEIADDIEIHDITRSVMVKEEQNTNQVPQKYHSHNYEMIEPKHQITTNQIAEDTIAKNSNCGKKITDKYDTKFTAHNVKSDEKLKNNALYSDINHNEKINKKSELKEERIHTKRHEKNDYKRRKPTRERDYYKRRPKQEEDTELSRIKTSKTRNENREKQRRRENAPSSSRKFEERKRVNKRSKRGVEEEKMTSRRSNGKSNDKRESSTYTNGEDQRQARPKYGRSKTDTYKRSRNNKRNPKKS